jgi:hypothetical protein
VFKIVKGHSPAHWPRRKKVDYGAVAVATCADFDASSPSQGSRASATAVTAPDGARIEPSTHFRFVNGERDTVVVRVLPDGLLFKSNLR